MWTRQRHRSALLLVEWLCSRHAPNDFQCTCCHGKQANTNMSLFLSYLRAAPSWSKKVQRQLPYRWYVDREYLMDRWINFVNILFCLFPKYDNHTNCTLLPFLLWNAHLNHCWLDSAIKIMDKLGAPVCVLRRGGTSDSSASNLSFSLLESSQESDYKLVTTCCRCEPVTGHSAVTVENVIAVLSGNCRQRLDHCLVFKPCSVNFWSCHFYLSLFLLFSPIDDWGREQAGRWQKWTLRAFNSCSFFVCLFVF